jgi:hypothetical protein
VFNSVFLPRLSWTGTVICDKCSTREIEIRVPETKSNRLQVFGAILYRERDYSLVPKPWAPKTNPFHCGFPSRDISVLVTCDAFWNDSSLTDCHSKDPIINRKNDFDSFYSSKTVSSSRSSISR